MHALQFCGVECNCSTESLKRIYPLAILHPYMTFRMSYGSLGFSFAVFVTLFFSSVNSQWVTKKAAEWAIFEFGRLEVERKERWFKGTDRRE